MDNVEIGPSSKEEWILGDYAHARLMVPRLKGLIEEFSWHGTSHKKVPLADRFNNKKRGLPADEILSNL